jgi:hypothetical protein
MRSQLGDILRDSFHARVCRQKERPMNFDFNKTIGLVKGSLLDHEATWNSYLGENPAAANLDSPAPDPVMCS